MVTGKSLPSPFLELCLQQTILRDEVMSPGGTKNRLAKKEVESPNHALHLDGSPPCQLQDLWDRCYQNKKEAHAASYAEYNNSISDPGLVCLLLASMK